MAVASDHRLRSLSGREPAGYVAHSLHTQARTYAETNCYTDILIELLHACGYEPLAALGSLVRMDFEGDQWTFFKPAPEDLELLYGIDIHEMQPYRSLPLQIAEQIELGRTIIVELDSFHLPDTAGTSYRSEHVKTSVAAEAIDLDGERLRYFHNAGLYECSGEDYRGVFRLGAAGEAVLPPYVELVRFDAGERVSGERLHGAAVEILRHHLQRSPRSNPFPRFGVQLARELPRLLEGSLEEYHAYAFATVRMAGAAFELAAAHARWLFGSEAAEAAAAMVEMVVGCTALPCGLARRRAFDPEPAIAGLASAWSRALEALRQSLV